MRSKILNKLMNFVDNGSYSEEEIEKIHYGFEALYILITKGIVVFTISYFLGLIKYTFFFLVVYAILRSFAGGLHATKSWICLVSSVLIFIILPYLCKILIIDHTIRITIMLISTILILIYSPADTKKRPIISKSKRKKLRTISTIISVIYIIASFFIRNEFVLNSLAFGILLEVIMILPITYKLFKLPYNNYISYLKTHNLERRV